MSAFSGLLSLPEDEKVTRGLVYTPAEIAQQPDTWRLTSSIFEKRQPEIREFLAGAGINAPDLRDRPTVFLIGAGTSDYVGRSLTALLRKRWRCEVLAIPSTDLLTHLDEICFPDKKYLWISFSRSGDSPEGVAVLEQARSRHPDIYQLVVSCNLNGKMIRNHAGDSHLLGVCLDDAVNDRGLAMTSSFSNMVIFGQCLAHYDDFDNYSSMLKTLVKSGKDFLPLAAECASALATAAYTKACFIGSGALRAVAKESSLKLLEMTAGRVITMSESALGLRHGPMAALDGDTLLVCFLSGEAHVQSYERALLHEIKSKKLVITRVVVCPAGTQNSNTIAEYALDSVAEKTADDYRVPVDIIFGQMLGLFFSLARGLQPDCPSPNGAISRVVPSVIDVPE